MLPSTYTLGNQTQTTTSTSSPSSTTTLRHQLTDVVNQMFTTIYGGDNSVINDHPSICDPHPQSALDTLVDYYTNSTPTTILNSSAAAAIPWTTTPFTPASPTSPALSYFSSSENDTETDTEPFFTPVTCLTPHNDFYAADTSLDAAMMVGLEDDSMYYSSSDYLFAGSQGMGDLVFETTANDLFAAQGMVDLFFYKAVDEIGTVAASPSAPSLGGVEHPAAEVVVFADEYQQQQQYQHHHSGDERDQGQEEKSHNVDEGALHIAENDDNEYNTCSSMSQMATTAKATTAKATGTTGGPSRRSGSGSRVATFAPYPSSSSSSSSSTSAVPSSSSISRKNNKYKKSKKNSNKSDGMWQQLELYESERHHLEQEEQVDTNNPIGLDHDNVVSTSAPSSSLASEPSSHSSAPGTSVSISVPASSSSTPVPAAPVRIPGTEGMTAIHQKDGSVMCFNPATGTCTYFCALCLAAADPLTSSSSSSSTSLSGNGRPQSFGRIHDLKRHQRTKHPQAASIHGRGPAKVWSCEFCQNSFTRRDALLRHYTVKSVKGDGVHPTMEQQELIDACRARAKSI